MVKEDFGTDVASEIEEQINKQNAHSLVLYNDDVNTFDFVIDCLIKLCSHTTIQAEQCTMLIHYKGRCAVKEGEFKKLKPICESFLELGITAKIENN